MKTTLPLPCLIVAALILQLTLLTRTGAQQNADRVGAISPTTSSSRKSVAEEITCAAGLTIAKCITSTAGSGKFTTFAKLTQASDFEQLLNGPGPYTVFVPTDEAFSALGNNDPPDAGPPPTEVASAAPKNEQRTRTRVVKINSWPNEPVKIVSAKLRAGDQIKPGVPFPALDDWVRGLTLTVTNVSTKPVCFIHVQLHLPRPDDEAGEAANDALMFVCDPVTTSTPKPLMPGMSIDMVLTDSNYPAHEALLERNDYPPFVRDLELKVLEVEFFGDKNRKWSKGQMMRQDPNNPGDWCPDRP